MKTKFLTLGLIILMGFTACSDDDSQIIDQQPQPTTFRLTLKNTINYLNVKKIGDAPLTTTGQTFTVDFKATKGTYLSFANMFAQTNDWFFATEDTGVKLWDGDTPKTGDISNYVRVFDAGTEEDENFLTDFPSTMYTAPNQTAANTGPADDNTSVRDTDRNILNYLTASLAYNSSNKYFTLTITKADRSGAHNPGFVTPGILVVHTQPNAFFEEGQSVRQNGLESLAEDGSPQALYDWFHETGSTGSPLRLSSSFSVFSPGVAYVHNGDQSPFFTRGETAMASSGLKELAEDGNADIAYQYLNGLENVTAVKSDGGIPPGQSKTFEIQALPGQRLNFATMFVASNDWFVSNNQAGIELFDADGSVKAEFDIYKNYLYDAGTELDEAVGFGAYQPMGAMGQGSAGPDTDTSVRRVTQIEDVQFGKGAISSAAGVTQNNDPRGGYNLIEVTVEVVN